LKVVKKNIICDEIRNNFKKQYNFQNRNEAIEKMMSKLVLKDSEISNVHIKILANEG
jgi:ribosomal protein L20A (L18A)